jgi:hypothetical protein
MSVQTAAGTKLYISASQPATFDETGYDTLFTTVPIPPELGEITGGLDWGRVFQLVTHNPVGSRGTQKFKGSFDEGSMTLSLAYDSANAGQEVAYDAADSDDDHSFMLELPDGERFFFQAKVMSFKVGAPDVNSMVTASIEIQITTNSAGVGIIRSLVV